MVPSSGPLVDKSFMGTKAELVAAVVFSGAEVVLEGGVVVAGLLGRVVVVVVLRGERGADGGAAGGAAGPEGRPVVWRPPGGG